MLIANFISCNSLWWNLRFFFTFYLKRSITMCNSIDSNFAIGMFWRDLSFEIDSPLITNAVFSRLTREWTVRLFNFSFADWSQIMIYLSVKKLCLMMGCSGLLYYLLLCSGTMRTTTSKIKFVFGNNTFGWFYCEKLANRLRSS